MPTGTGILNFGTGTFEASADVTGQTAILTTSHVEAFIMAESTIVSDPPGHDADEHRIFDAQYKLTCTIPIAGDRFTVQALARGLVASPRAGNFKFHWVWNT